MNDPLLTVSNLEVQFAGERGQILAVRDINFSIAQGEVVSVLGESGSGKSVTSRAVIGLVDCPPGRVTGSIRFDGQEFVGASESALRAVRGGGIGMVFQDALDALNPTYPIGRQLSEVFRVRQHLGRREAKERSAALLSSVGIRDAVALLKDYPHQLSGGMRQRVCIAMAIALEPKLLIADEPTTALDVTVQAEILRLLKELQVRTGMAMLFVTHDVAVARLVADRIIVMYAGQVLEEGPAHDVAVRSAHPYTRALLGSQPGSVRDWDWHDLKPIGGSPPDKASTITGCPFESRCPRPEAICSTQDPPLVPVGPRHSALCHFALEVRHGQR